jgi:UDP-glucuronate 4-epimerase
MKILVTGAAGFIGGHVSKLLTECGHEVIGFDNFSTYYSPGMKKAHLSSNTTFPIEEIDISEHELVFRRFSEISPDCVIHLAAQGGVRASTTNPMPYITANQIGFLNVLQASEKVGVGKFIYASSSSVYGEGLEAPFRENSILPAPKSLYALSKLSNEGIAKNLPSAGVERIGLRFFTVYGPWGRPDMAVFRLLASALLGREFLLTANLDIKRDFTFVADVAATIQSIIQSASFFENEIFNVASNNPYSLTQLFQLLDSYKISPNIVKAKADLMDVNLTHGSTEKLANFGLSVPQTTLEVGLQLTWEWIQKIDRDDLRDWFDYSAH